MRKKLNGILQKISLASLKYSSPFWGSPVACTFPPTSWQKGLCWMGPSVAQVPNQSMSSIIPSIAMTTFGCPKINCHMISNIKSPFIRGAKTTSPIHPSWRGAIKKIKMGIETVTWDSLPQTTTSAVVTMHSMTKIMQIFSWHALISHPEKRSLHLMKSLFLVPIRRPVQDRLSKTLVHVKKAPKCTEV